MHQVLLIGSAFYEISKRLLAIPLRCCSDACDCHARTLAFCIFLGRRGIAVSTLLWCDMGLKAFRTDGVFLKRILPHMAPYASVINKTAPHFQLLPMTKVDQS